MRRKAGPTARPDVFDLGTVGARPLSRRDLFSRSATIGGGLAVAPFFLRDRGPTSSQDPRTLAEGAAPADATFGPGLDAFIRTKMREAYLPSLAAAVARGQDLKWAEGYGRADREADIAADADTVYMMASISKTFICAGVMQLWEEASLDLDADIDTYLPFSVRTANHPGRKITMRMLLTHTSGIRDRYSVWGTLANPNGHGYALGDPAIPLGDWLADYLVPGGAYYMAEQNFYDLAPGSTYHYSNIGADLAAYIVEVISGESFGTYVQNHLLAPLGMTQSGFHLADITTPNLAMPYRVEKPTRTYVPYGQFGYPDYPSGLMRTSANALSIWMRCFMNYGSFEGTQILKRSTVKEIFRPQLPGNWWQGLIFYYERRRGRLLVGHSGSDYGTHTDMFFSPHDQIGAITFANRYLGGWKAWYRTRDIQNRLLDIA